MPLDTQPGRRLVERMFRSPLALSVLVVLANAVKPVTVDDTAYLTFARHIAQHPLDPYGFTIYWYSQADPAFEILAPPVLPYWLALGIHLFGESVPLLKLWLFPFVWLFAWSVNDLLRRFARGAQLLAVVVLSPAVLPTVNLMLDLPALALGLAAIACLARARDRNWGPVALAAGISAALAMQTKYTMLVVPPILLWYGLTHRRLWPALVAPLVGAAGFIGWEVWLAQKYGQSHFVHHALSQTQEPRPGSGRLESFLADKLELAPGLAGHLGCLGVGAGLVAAAAVGVGRRWIGPAAAAWVIGLGLVALLPGRWSRGWVYIYWQLFGGIFLGAVVACAALLLVRWRSGPSLRSRPDSRFLAGWLVVELAAYFVLTPFPAARRVIGLAVVGMLLAARAISRTGRVAPTRRPARWMAGVTIGAGFVVAGIDTLDAFPERMCAERAAALTADRPAGSSVWFVGHWGFQYYCERAGMRPLIPGESVVAAGDFLVLPVHPEAMGFYRPHFGFDPPDVKHATVVGEVVWEDPVAAQTVPNFYGGINPVAGREYPRLRVVVYRIMGEWRPSGP